MQSKSPTFYGWRVVGGAFVLAVFGLGIGFHGPAVYLHAVHDRRGWPLALISMAVTLHFLVGSIVVANLPELYRRFGVPAITKVGATLLAIAFNRAIRGHYSPDAHLGLEVTGLYWHFVDVVWIFLYTVVYLL